MKKLQIIVSILGMSLLLVGCNKLEEQRAEHAIKKYYQALVEENYEAAFQELYLYDNDFLDGQTSLPQDEAEQMYLDKVTFLQEQHYRVIDFTITELEYEDGHSFWHHLNVETVQNGESFTYDEPVFFREGKLQISGDDPFIRLRDGKMNVHY